MIKQHRLITALLTFIFCITAFSFTAYAVGENTGDQPSGGDDTSSIIEPPTYAPPVESDPQSSQSDVSSDPPQYNPDYNNSSNYYSEPDYYSSNDYDYNDNSQSSELYVGGGQTYDPPASTAASVPVYDVDSKKIDDSVLSSKDWKDIQASLNNAGDSNSGDDDFSFIKNNDSKLNNGDWMLFLGIALIILSIAGISYVVIEIIKQRKGVTVGGFSHRKMPGRVKSRNAVAHRPQSNHNDAAYRSYQKAQEKELERSRKYNTAEVHVPKNSSGKRYKNGGRRYK
ncbi:hypothetical protein [Ruminococcus sp. YE282]|uniref:hypothetical protein n=1 Tax=Ruminococcus sp. YE282 TaxID=3158780 RepID=UPI0008884B83|nr:hypothetical protein SAMN02910441_00458 [Ruminococcus bromii]